MPQNQKKRQKALEKQKAKRKQKQSSQRSGVTASNRSLFRAAAGWPLYECLITANWQDEGEIIQILVARQSQAGRIAYAIFLVDLGCLGVKNASADVLPSEYDYREGVRKYITSMQPVVEADLDLVAKVIQEAVAYAKSLGFNPHRDYTEASLILTGANPAASDVDVPLGKDGKPFYVSGPHDNPALIIAKLEKAVGAGNFEYVLLSGDPNDYDPDEDADYDPDDDEEEELEEPEASRELPPKS